MTELLEVGISGLDPFVLTNPVIEELVQADGGCLPAWPDIIEHYIAWCDEELESAADEIIKAEYSEVDRYDATSDLDVLVSQLVDWLDDGDIRSRLLLQQARLREWAGDDPGPSKWHRDASSLLMQAVFGRAAPEDDVFSDLDS